MVKFFSSGYGLSAALSSQPGLSSLTIFLSRFGLSSRIGLSSRRRRDLSAA